MNNSLGSPSIVTETILEKYVKKVPAYRQEQQWQELGFMIDRKSIINWHLKSVDNVLEPLYDLLHKKYSFKKYFNILCLAHIRRL
ncbi:MAG: IS66 family transposase [Streptococcaceae bacterium]|nr:IS66 family transposase [Streptococcaceae bacterium]